MTTIDPLHVAIDGHILATYANALEAVDGIDGLPGRRISDHAAAGVDGSYPHPDAGPAMFGPRHQTLRIWVSPFNADGNVTHANGPRAHLRENLDNLLRILGGTSRSSHQVDWIVPTPAGAALTLRNTARISLPIQATGSTRLVRRFAIGLTYPWPFFRDVTTGLQTVGPFTGAEAFTPLGTAPLADMILTCTSAGRLTWDETEDFVEATTGFTTALVINQRPPRSALHGASGDTEGRAFYNGNRIHGLRFNAGEEANLTATGTWQIDYYPQHH
jgi:hypothetical protein